MTDPLTDLEPEAPARPRLGGWGAAVLGLVGFAAAVAVFGLVLVLLGVIPNPLHRPTHSQGEPAPTSSPGLLQLPKPARFAQPGDCLLNVGTEDRPDMIMVSCRPGALDVLERIEGTVDVHQCDKIPDYRFYYFYDSDLGDSLDFVLCMRKRP